MATTKKNRTSAGTGNVAAGALAAAVAAGAAYYFIADKNAKKHRASAVKWAERAQKDLAKEAKKLGKLDDAIVRGIAERVAETYEVAQKAAPRAKKAVVKKAKKAARILR